MKPVNYLYPLPKENLIKRYKPVFDALQTKSSVTQFGIPMSGNFVFLKFVFSNEELKKIFHITDPYHLFIFLDFDSLPELTTQWFHKHILFQLVRALEKLPIKMPKELTEILSIAKQTLVSSDAFFLFQQSIELISMATKMDKFQFTFIIHDYFIEQWDEAWGRNLYRLWHIHRRHPDTRVNFLFITKPFLSPDSLPLFLRPLRFAYFESLHTFPLFDKTETFYTLTRLEKLYSVTIPPNLKEHIWNTFGGFYEFYMPVIDSIKKYGIPKNVKNLEKIWHIDPQVLYYANHIISSIPIAYQNAILSNSPSTHDSFLTNLGIRKESLIWPIYIKNISLKNKQFEINLPNAEKIWVKSKLTASERILLDLFLKNKNTLLSKEQIAKTIWPDDSSEATDWAIDKLISRLRNKLSTPTHLDPIITIRSKGFKFIEE